MPSPSSEAGRAYAVALEEQLDAASQCPVAASREYVVPDGMRPTAAAKERGRYICFALGGQIECRLLEKHGKSDRDNVRRPTGVGSMAAVSRGLGLVSRETTGEASAGSAP